MRFLILTQYYAPEIGATQVRLGAVARTLRSLGHDVEVLTALPNYPAGEIFPAYRGTVYAKEEINGITVHRVWIYPATGSGLERLANYFSFVFLSWLPLLRARRPDYIWVDSPPLFISITGYFFAKLVGAKMIFTVADLWPASVEEMGIVTNKLILNLAKKLEEWTYRSSYRITAVTDGIYERLKQRGIPAAKLLKLVNGVDAQLFHPRPADEELLEKLHLRGKKVILYAGGLGYAQGLDTVIDAAALLAPHPEIVFVFIGAGPEKNRLQARVSQEGLTNVRFLEQASLEYVARLYSLALAGLTILKDLPLFRGARPSKMLPAMAAGVPVIYSGAGEGADLVSRAQAGLVVRPEDPAALAQTVLHLARNPEIAGELGRNGRAFAEQHLSWSAIINDWLRQLLGNGKET